MEKEILNFSMVEEDPFVAINKEEQNITEVAHEWETWKPTNLEVIIFLAYLSLHVIRFFLVIAVVLTDILLAYLILRYKRLKKNFNLYILHYVVMNFSYHSISPIFLMAHLLFRSGFAYLIYCTIGMLEKSFLFMSLLFAILLGLDWTVCHYKPHYLKQIQAAYNRKFSILYGLLLLLTAFNILSCYMGFHFFELIFISLPLFITALVAMHFIRRRGTVSNEQLKTEHYLWISTFTVGWFIPLYIMDILITPIRLILVHNDSYSNIISLILSFLENIFSICAEITPIYILIYLMKWNKHVKMAFDVTFRRTVRSYGSDNLDDASDNEEIIENDAQKNIQRITNGAGTQEIMVP